MNVPKLRFPEFQEKWKEDRLGVICDSISSGKDKSDPDGAYDLFGSTGVIGKTSSDTFDGKFLLVARVGANAGLLTIAIGKFGVTDNTLVIYLKKPACIDFVFYYLESLRLNRLVFGSGQPLITGGQLKALPLFLPNNSEQQKIADSLSSIDDLITAQTQKLVTLKTHKKGLMQQLFPAEGETLPKLRFPEFQDDWVIKKLGELGKLIGGGTPDKSVAEYWQGEIPWVSSSDIYEDDINTISVTRFINEKSISESATKKVPKGSVLFVSRVGTGKLAINDNDVCTSQDFMNFMPKKIYNYYLGYFFIVNKSALISLGQGTSIKGFSKGDLEKLEVSYPGDLEQQKIADCLSSIDDLITAQSQKIDILKAHKKGLMQQLFPAIDSKE